MRVIYADTANLVDIQELNEMGVIRGVTTNPSLISKEPKQNYDNLLHELAIYCKGHSLSFSVEVFETEPEAMFEAALALNYKLLGSPLIESEFLHIKIPVGIEEIKIIKRLAKSYDERKFRDIRVNCTCCYTEAQLEMAALAGAKYVSLFYNRARDAGIDVNEVLRSTKNFIISNNLDCKIIAGSIRKPQDITDAWNAGADIVTCSPKIIKEALHHEGTKASIEGFVKDFQQWISE
jgi:TalC/MipB family fructose-6-phosphate aldolase